MNTLGLRAPSGTGESIFLLGPVSAQIETILNSNIISSLSTNVDSPILSAEIDKSFSASITPTLSATIECSSTKIYTELLSDPDFNGTDTWQYKNLPSGSWTSVGSLPGILELGNPNPVVLFTGQIRPTTPFTPTIGVEYYYDLIFDSMAASAATITLGGQTIWDYSVDYPTNLTKNGSVIATTTDELLMTFILTIVSIDKFSLKVEA